MWKKLLCGWAVMMLSGSVLAQAVPGAPATAAGQTAALRVSFAKEINDLSTFKTLGLDRKTIDTYLEGGDGQQLLAELSAADASAPAETIYARAVEQLAAGSNLPTLWPTSTPLVKIVPHGQSVSPYSPYFTTLLQLQATSIDCPTLADCFGLPLKSEADLYDVYEIAPKGTVKVFISKVAPTEELGGWVRHKGGALQHIVPNRGLWSAPVLVGTVKN